jgi:hypothetical protein
MTGNPMYPPEMLAQKEAEVANHAKNALIMSIIGFFCLGFILGLLAFRKANEGLQIIDIYQVGHEKRGMLMTAKVLSIIDIVMWAIGLLLRIFVLR